MLPHAVLLADDHSMIRKGLRLHLQFDLGVSEVQEASSCHEVMSELRKKKYTHLVLDMILADGSSLEVIPNIRAMYPDLKIMIFSMQPENIYAKALEQYGIHNYLSKLVEEPELLTGLRKFLSDESSTRPETLRGPADNNPFSQLTPRQLEILHYLLRGIGTKEISGHLNIKLNTVSTIKKQIYEKTNCLNLRELMELATLYNINY